MYRDNRKWTKILNSSQFSNFCLPFTINDPNQHFESISISSYWSIGLKQNIRPMVPWRYKKLILLVVRDPRCRRESHRYFTFKIYEYVYCIVLQNNIKLEEARWLFAKSRLCARGQRARHAKRLEVRWRPHCCLWNASLSQHLVCTSVPIEIRWLRKIIGLEILHNRLSSWLVHGY